MNEGNKLVYKTTMDTSGFAKGINSIKSGFKGLSGVTAGFAAGLGGREIFNFVKDLADAAGNLETVNRSFERVFGNLSSAAGEELDKVANALGRSTTALKKGAVSFDTFFRGLGFASKEAADMAINLQKLSLDLASFFGIADENAQKRMLAALAGSPEVLDQFGINLKQQELQNELYRMGLKSTVQMTDEVTKSTARLNIIMRSMTNSGIVGDAARAMDTYAGKVKEMGAAWITFKEDVGNIILPAITDIMEKISTFSKSTRQEIDYVIEKLNDARKFSGIQTVDEKAQEQVKEAVDGMSLLLYLKEGILNVSRDSIDNQNALSVLGKEEYIRRAAILEIQKQEVADSEKTEIQKKMSVILANELLILQSKINDEASKQNVFEEQNKKQALNKLDIIQQTWDFQQKIKEIDGIKYTDLVEQISLYQQLVDQSSQLLKWGAMTTEEYKNQITYLNELKRKKAEIEKVVPVSLEKKQADPLSTSMTSDALKSIPESMDLVNVEPVDWNTMFGMDGFWKVMTSMKDGKEQFKVESFDLVNGLNEMGFGLANSLGGGFATAVSETLKGGVKLGQAIKIATKQSMIAYAADLAGRALYYAILGAGYAIGGAIAQDPEMVKKGIGYLKTAATFGAGAALLGGGAKAIKAPSGFGGGGSANKGTNDSGKTFEDYLNAIQGEQVFRLAGNDLVTAMNRTNTFQGTIGG
jgi:hypothetical protein